MDKSKKDIYDVVVIGGGVAGVSAAITAAEMGARTALIEKESFLGGMPVGAYVIAMCGYYNGKFGKEKVIRGNFEKIANRAIKMGFAEGTKWNKRCKPSEAREITIDPEGFKYVLDQVVLDSRVDLYLRSFALSVCGDATFMKMDIEVDTGIYSVSVAGKFGWKVIRSKMFIDCTGDADTAEWLGLTTMYSIVDGPVTMSIRIGGVDKSKLPTFDEKHPAPEIKFEDGIYELVPDRLPVFGWMDIKDERNQYFDCMAIIGTQGLNWSEITYAEVRGRELAHEAIKKLAKMYPAYKNAYLLSTGSLLGSRKPRMVITQYYLTDEDENQNPYDSIAIAGNVIADVGAMKIPFRCLLPKRVTNLLYAGRTFTPMYHPESKRRPEQSKKRNMLAYEIPRLIGCCTATGEAAGVAAALCADTGDTTDMLKYKDIQKVLEKRGAIF